MDNDPHGETPPDRAGSAAEQVTVPVPVGPRPGVRYASGSAAVPAGPAWTAPTSVHPVEPTVPDPPPAPPARSRLWWIAGALVVAVVAAIVIVRALPSGSTGGGPAQAVTDYFAALAGGDATSALAQVDDAGRYGEAADPLLSPVVLSRAADRPSGVTVTGTVATSVGGHAASAVSVRYTLGGTTVSQTITVLDRTSTQPYLLQSPFVTVALPNRKVTVNGVTLPAGTAHTLGFPAAYTATAAGTGLIAAATAPAGYDTTDAGTVEARFSMPPPALAPGAGTLVQAAVDKALDACAASATAAPAGCPFRYSGDAGASVTWTVESYPKVGATVDGGTVTFDDGGHPGKIGYTATTTILFGLIPRTDQGTQSVDVAGTATLVHGDVTVSFTP